MGYKIDYSKPCHVHFIGIGGMSMSGLAYILMRNGYVVTGSDKRTSIESEYLKKVGIPVCIGHDAKNITDDIGLLVYNAAIHPDNPEFAKAYEMGIPMLTRGELLGQIMQMYETSIGVSGTHGKTTTTSILAHILLAADLDPTISVGSELPKIGGTVRFGQSPVFLAEACEYTNSYHNLFPWIEVILNIEREHMDFFKDLQDLRNSFHTYFTHVPENGYVVINNAIKDLPELTKDLTCHVVTYGVEDKNADYQATNITLIPETPYYQYDLVNNHTGETVLHAKLNIPGLHNVCNSLAAITAALMMDLSVDAITQALLEYHGAGSRFEYKGTIGGAKLYDDYAHHPQEVEATLQAASNFPHKSIWAIFQPHTYSRTKMFFQEFIDALKKADHVIVAELFAARETDTYGVNSQILTDALKEQGVDAYYLPTYEEMEKFLLSRQIDGDLLITMGGSGNIHEFGDYLFSDKLK